MQLFSCFRVFACIFVLFFLALALFLRLLNLFGYWYWFTNHRGLYTFGNHFLIGLICSSFKLLLNNTLSTIIFCLVILLNADCSCWSRVFVLLLFEELFGLLLVFCLILRGVPFFLLLYFTLKNHLLKIISYLQFNLKLNQNNTYYFGTFVFKFFDQSLHCFSCFE